MRKSMFFGLFMGVTMMWTMGDVLAQDQVDKSQSPNRQVRRPATERTLTPHEKNAAKVAEWEGAAKVATEARVAEKQAKVATETKKTAWTEKTSGSAVSTRGTKAAYNVTVMNVTGGGTVTGDMSVESGSTPEFTLIVDEGYELESATVATLGGEKVTSTLSGNKLSFTMPEEDVNLIVRFRMAMPKGLNVEIGNGEAVVSWTTGGSETAWEVAVGKSIPLPADTKITKVNETMYRFSVDAGSYYILVRAVNGDLKSEWATATFTFQCGGTWTVDMYDSYGDSWNGASIVYTNADGVETTITHSDGSSSSKSVDINGGKFTWVKGYYDEEISFTITNEDGVVMYTCEDATNMSSRQVFLTVNCDAYKCAAPSLLNFTATSTTEGKIDWVANGGTESWDVVTARKVMSTEELNKATATTCNSTICNLKNLEQGRIYMGYVRSACEGSESDWKNLNFYTDTLADVTTNAKYYNNVLKIDTLETSTLIENGYITKDASDTYGSLCYKFTVTKSGIYRIQMYSSEIGNNIAYLYRGAPKGELISSGNDLINDEVLGSLSVGTYYLEVRCIPTSLVKGGEYSLVVKSMDTTPTFKKVTWNKLVSETLAVDNSGYYNVYPAQFYMVPATKSTELYFTFHSEDIDTWAIAVCSDNAMDGSSEITTLTSNGSVTITDTVYLAVYTNNQLGDYDLMVEPTSYADLDYSKTLTVGTAVTGTFYNTYKHSYKWNGWTSNGYNVKMEAGKNYLITLTATSDKAGDIEPCINVLNDELTGTFMTDLIAYYGNLGYGITTMTTVLGFSCTETKNYKLFIQDWFGSWKNDYTLVVKEYSGAIADQDGSYMDVDYSKTLTVGKKVTDKVNNITDIYVKDAYYGGHAKGYNVTLHKDSTYRVTLDMTSVGGTPYEMDYALVLFKLDENGNLTGTFSTDAAIHNEDYIYEKYESVLTMEYNPDEDGVYYLLVEGLAYGGIMTLNYDVIVENVTTKKVSYADINYNHTLKVSETATGTFKETDPFVTDGDWYGYGKGYVVELEEGVSYTLTLKTTDVNNIAMDPYIAVLLETDSTLVGGISDKEFYTGNGVTDVLNVYNHSITYTPTKTATYRILLEMYSDDTEVAYTFQVVKNASDLSELEYAWLTVNKEEKGVFNINDAKNLTWWDGRTKGYQVVLTEGKTYSLTLTTTAGTDAYIDAFISLYNKELSYIDNWNDNGNGNLYSTTATGTYTAEVTDTFKIVIANEFDEGEMDESPYTLLVKELPAYTHINDLLTKSKSGKMSYSNLPKYETKFFTTNDAAVISEDNENYFPIDNDGTLHYAKAYAIDLDWGDRIYVDFGGEMDSYLLLYRDSANGQGFEFVTDADDNGNYDSKYGHTGEYIDYVATRKTTYYVVVSQYSELVTGNWDVTIGKNESDTYFVAESSATPVELHVSKTIVEVNSIYPTTMEIQALLGELKLTLVAGGKTISELTNFTERWEVSTSDKEAIYTCGENEVPIGYQLAEGGESVIVSLRIKGDGLENVSVENKATLYPNPAADFCYIKVNGVDAERAVVYDLIGRVVLDQVLTGAAVEQLNVSKLASGIYQVRIKQNGVTIQTLKLIKK